MTPERYELVQRLFNAARRLEGDERRVFIDRECGSDRELRETVEILLSYDSRPLPEPIAPPADPGMPTRPEQIGPYRIQRTLGEVDDAHAALAEFFEDAIVADRLADHEDAIVPPPDSEDSKRSIT